MSPGRETERPHQPHEARRLTPSTGAGVRGIAPWVLGSILAFVITSGAFLLLANLGTEPSEVRLEPRQPPPKSDSSLELDLDEERLASLNASRNQSITLNVRNGGGVDLSTVNLTVEVYSEDTSLPEARRYRKTIEGLDSGESAEVEFDLNLSPPETTNSYSGTEPPRTIIEVRATTPDGVSAIRTAVLQL